MLYQESGPRKPDFSTVGFLAIVWPIGIAMDGARVAAEDISNIVCGGCCK